MPTRRDKEYREHDLARLLGQHILSALSGQTSVDAPDTPRECEGRRDTYNDGAETFARDADPSSVPHPECILPEPADRLPGRMTFTLLRPSNEAVAQRGMTAYAPNWQLLHYPSPTVPLYEPGLQFLRDTVLEPIAERFCETYDPNELFKSETLLNAAKQFWQHDNTRAICARLGGPRFLAWGASLNRIHDFEESVFQQALPDMQSAITSVNSRNHHEVSNYLSFLAFQGARDPQRIFFALLKEVVAATAIKRDETGEPPAANTKLNVQLLPLASFGRVRAAAIWILSDEERDAANLPKLLEAGLSRDDLIRWNELLTHGLFDVAIDYAFENLKNFEGQDNHDGRRKHGLAVFSNILPAKELRWFATNATNPSYSCTYKLRKPELVEFFGGAGTLAWEPLDNNSKKLADRYKSNLEYFETRFLREFVQANHLLQEKIKVAVGKVAGTIGHDLKNRLERLKFQHLPKKLARIADAPSTPRPARKTLEHTQAVLTKLNALYGIAEVMRTVQKFSTGVLPKLWLSDQYVLNAETSTVDFDASKCGENRITELKGLLRDLLREVAYLEFCTSSCDTGNKTVKLYEFRQQTGLEEIKMQDLSPLDVLVHPDQFLFPPFAPLDDYAGNSGPGALAVLCPVLEAMTNACKWTAHNAQSLSEKKYLRPVKVVYNIRTVGPNGLELNIWNPAGDAGGIDASKSMNNLQLTFGSFDGLSFEAVKSSRGPDFNAPPYYNGPPQIFAEAPEFYRFRYRISLDKLRFGEPYK